MMLDNQSMALATSCLWSLQESTTIIEGLLLSRIDGLTVTSTMQGDDSTQRLAAASTAMFLLCERASNSWGRGDSTEVHIKLRQPDNFDAEFSHFHHVFMKPVGNQAVLVAVCNNQHNSYGSIHHYLDRAANFLDAVLDGDSPALPHWTA